jgi:hypothetical protein
LQQAEISLGARADKAEEALDGLSSAVLAASAAASGANTMITAVSNAAKSVPRPPNAAMVAALSKPVKQMASDARVLKNYITGQMGEFVPSATFGPLIRDSFDYYGGNCAFRDDVATCGNWFQLPGSVDVYVIDAANDRITRSANIRSPSVAVPSTTSNFGIDVAINSKWLVIGAPLDFVSRTNKVVGGRIYVYHMGTSKGSVTTTFHELSHPQPASFDDCGQTVAVFGDMVAAACPMDDTGSVRDHGSILLFQYDSVKRTFGHLTTVTHMNAANFQNLGRSSQAYYQATLEFQQDMVIAGKPRTVSLHLSACG